MDNGKYISKKKKKREEGGDRKLEVHYGHG
jgi:hypothetical protein